MHLLIAGTSGLVGGLALRQALTKPGIDRITGVGRRKLPLTDPKLEQLEWDFTAPERLAPALPPADAAICALGSTMRKAGSRAAFHAVDHDAVLAFAALAKAAGASRFAVVSSVGASSRSGSFYLATKGRMEERLERFGFAMMAILRPSFLIGPRQEERPGERIGLLLARMIEPALTGAWRRYRPIGAGDVAAALLQAVMAEPPAGGIFEHDEILRLAER